MLDARLGKLAALSQALADHSDTLNDVIEALDSAIRDTKIGVTAWVWIDNVPGWLLGWAKSDHHGWCLLASGPPPDDEEPRGPWADANGATTVPLLRAPREVRTAAAGAFTLLLDRLIHRAEEILRNVQGAVADAKEPTS